MGGGPERSTGGDQTKVEKTNKSSGLPPGGRHGQQIRKASPGKLCLEKRAYRPEQKGRGGEGPAMTRPLAPFCPRLSSLPGTLRLLKKSLKITWLTAGVVEGVSSIGAYRGEIKD